MLRRRIVIVVYPGFELLDLSGPASVFTGANEEVGRQAYEVNIVSQHGGLVASSSRVEVDSRSLASVRIKSRDTVLVVGALAVPLERAIGNRHYLNWLECAEKHCERLASVCSGAFILAACGVLDNCQATTHWAGVDTFRTMYPKVNVVGDALYLVDGKLWTSAGVTTGIDMTLEIVRRDLGAKVMGNLAKALVVYAHRPGNQAQFSRVLESQLAGRGEYAKLILWIADNLDKPLRVLNMAQFMNMSERNFYRKFTKVTGVSPAKYIEQQRLGRAKEHLEAGLPLKSVLPLVGFRSEAGFRRAFKAEFGLTPVVYQRMHHWA